MLTYTEPDDELDAETEPAALSLEEQLARLDEKQLAGLSLFIDLLLRGIPLTEKLVNKRQYDALIIAGKLGEAIR